MSNSSEKKTLKQKYADKQIKEARKQLWEMGDLQWKLDPAQKTMYDFFHNNKKKLTVFNASRRLGKSYVLTLIAIEQCIKKSKSVVKFLQPEQKMIRINIKPILEEILRDCPEELRPKTNRQDGIYEFPNGSQIQIAGTDGGNADSLRGGNASLAIVDEAGFCTDLKYIINSILIPTTTLTGGKIILSSTTPPNPNHDFIKYLQTSGLDGTLIVKTIDDAVEDQSKMSSPRITKEIVAEIVSSIPGGRDSQEFKTEYLCQMIFNSESGVIPEFTEEIEKDTVIEWLKPVYADKYVAMDIGFKDLTVVLFAYWDFQNAVLVIEDEIVLNGPKMTTELLANEIRLKEDILWRNEYTGETERPYLRISDNNLIVINDLMRLHDLLFIPTQKDNKEAAINQTRIMISERQIIIHPRCKTLVSHIKYAQWDKQHKDFARSSDNAHFDALAALVYLVRNINKERNPFPKGYKLSSLGPKSNLFVNESKYLDTSDHPLDKLFKQFQTKSSIRIKKDNN